MSLQRVMLIRHAEKPVNGYGGVDLAGRLDKDSLSPLGWQRAGALVRFFFPRADDASLVSVPDTIFAAGVGPDSSSKRSIQTASPLAKLLSQNHSVPFVTKYLKDDIESLVADVLGRQGCVLLVWEHKAMASIVEKLTAGMHRPGEWSDACFETVWILDAAGLWWTFSEVSQELLLGDNADGSALGCV